MQCSYNIAFSVITFSCKWQDFIVNYMDKYNYLSLCLSHPTPPSILTLPIHPTKLHLLIDIQASVTLATTGSETLNTSMQMLL